MEDTTQNTQRTLNSIVEMLAAIQTNLSQLNASVAVLTEKVTMLEARMEKLERRIDLLEMRMGKLEARMDRLEQRMSNIEEQMRLLSKACLPWKKKSTPLTLSLARNSPNIVPYVKISYRWCINLFWTSEKIFGQQK